MFEFFRKMWVGWIGIVMAYYVIILAVGAVIALANFAWLAFQGRLAEAATMYISVATFGAVVAFAVWVHLDATASSRRLEKYLKKDLTDDQEEDEDEDDTKSASEQIRASRDRTS